MHYIIFGFIIFIIRILNLGKFWFVHGERDTSTLLKKAITLHLDHGSRRQNDTLKKKNLQCYMQIKQEKCLLINRNNSSVGAVVFYMSHLFVREKKPLKVL